MIITDEELEGSFNWWLDHYTSCGEKHYKDTPDWKIREIYYDRIVDRVLEGLPEMDDEEQNIIIEKLNNL